MFGKNPLRKLERTAGEALDVQEVFSTIQGEGPYAGLPATFIRLWGCHLKCHFCDTDFESRDNPSLPIRVLLDNASRFNHRLVVLTGGEPMRQNILPLCDLLHDGGHLVQIETAGSFWFQSDTFKTRAPHVVVSPKTNYVNPQIEELADAWKYIIDSEDEKDKYDGLPIVDFQRTGNKLPLAKPPAGTPPEFIWVQPCDTGDKERNRVNHTICVELAKKYGYRVSIQQHKILGVP